MTTPVLRMAASALAIAAFAGMALAQDVAREDTVIFDLDRTIQDPENFNWMTPGTKRMHGAHQTMWEPLFILNYGSGELDPWLATGFESNADSTEFTVTLRDGVEWSDGEAFNADDVVFTVNLAMTNEEISSREASTIRSQVASVEKVDDLTVTFILQNPNPRFLVENFGVRIFGSFLIMPEHIWSGENAATFAFYPPIGTGPYTFTSASSNRAIWDRNDDWWGAKTGFMDLPAPKRVIFLESGGEESRAQLMLSNQLDAAQNVTIGTFEAIQAQNPNVIAWHDGYPYAASDPCARQLEINTTVAPWDNANMRKAVAHLIDRTQIVNIAYEGTTEASQTMFAQYGSMDPFINAVVDAGYGLSPNADPAAAQALIEGEGWTKDGDYYTKDGETLSVNIHVNSASTEYTRTIDVIVEQLQRAGIDARAVPVENGVFWGEVLPFGSYEMSYSWLSCGSVNEPWASMGRYTTADVVPVGERSPGFNNTARWDGEAAEAYTAIMADIAARPLGDEAVPGLVADAYQYLDAEMPFIPLVQAAKLLPMNTTYWTGWPTADNYYNHPFFWWNHTHQIIHNLEKAE
ncbi:ABC transporter substrate-binding protein [Marivita sp. S0852]|uniref:ABC transporter substrate-binding protein n=1 Tax=Marivita sp. S0852 TaxID=3373893 RepID=UPI003981EDDC